MRHLNLITLIIFVASFLFFRFYGESHIASHSLITVIRIAKNIREKKKTFLSKKPKYNYGNYTDGNEFSLQ